MKILLYALIYLAYCLFYSFSKTLLRRSNKSHSQTKCSGRKSSFLGLCRSNSVKDCKNHYGMLAILPVNCTLIKKGGKLKCRNGGMCM